MKAGGTQEHTVACWLKFADSPFPSLQTVLPGYVLLLGSASEYTIGFFYDAGATVQSIVTTYVVIGNNEKTYCANGKKSNFFIIIDRTVWFYFVYRRKNDRIRFVLATSRVVLDSSLHLGGHVFENGKQNTTSSHTGLLL